MQTLTVIVVSYNTRDLTRACLESIYRETALPDFEVIVVDNASTDGSAEMIRDEFPQVRLLALEKNVGFGAANNRAAAEANGRYILLLNPDTVVLDRAIDTLVAFAEAHPEYGIYGGSTFFADGSRNPTAGWNRPTAWSLFCVATGLARLFPGSRLFDPESLSGWEWNAPRAVDIVTGCLLLTTRAHWDALGGFDPHFFMYGEDADLCLRASAAGLQPVLVPEAHIIHFGGASEPKRADKMVRLFTAKAQLCRLHYTGLHAGACVAMLGLWSVARIAMFSVASPFKPTAASRKREWQEIWRARRIWSRSSAPAGVEAA